MLLLGLIGYLFLFSVVMLLALKYAPMGYEDENGFHYLTEKNKVKKITKKEVA